MPLRRKPDAVEVTQAPHEPSAAERLLDRGAVVAMLDRLASAARERGHAELLDAILDERAVVWPPKPLPLRPAVPIIPGRPT